MGFDFSSLIKGAASAITGIAKAQSLAEKHFEPRLIEMQLGKEHIRRQNLEDLQNSLNKIEELIRNKGSFGKVYVKVTPDGEAVLSGRENK
jgi:hypothetical protein